MLCGVPEIARLLIGAVAVLVRVMAVEEVVQ